jgi:hypothetical protein
MFVWGTNVDPTESMTKFRNFLLNFTIADRIQWEQDTNNRVGIAIESLSDEDRRPYYPRVLRQVNL